MKLDRITFYPIEEQTTMMNLYKAGEVDAVLNHTPPAAWVDSLRGKKDYVDMPEVGDRVLHVQHQEAADERRARAEGIQCRRGQGRARPFQAHREAVDGLYARGDFSRLPATERRPVRSGRAKKLLVEAGYGNSRGEFDPSKFPVANVELSYNTGENNKAIAEFVQAQWRQNLGLVISIKNIEWRTYMDVKCQARVQGHGPDGLDRRLHGSVLVPGAVLHAGW